ncbi:MAG: hypothetical protein JWQ76_5250 [Ramlibacter sp.]|nr:hypothetical protein [Ramlibacter sp.]
MNFDGWQIDDLSAHALLHRRPAVADLDNVQMIHTYMANGGLVTGDEVARRLRPYREQPVSVIARWIVARQVVCFTWRSETLVPLFQFDRSDMSLRPAVSEVLFELAGTLDDLELAQWFARPNGWLENAEPVAVIEADQPAVVQAARADRYVAKG